MAILKTILRTMTKQQRSKKLNWEGMSKCSFLSAHSDGTHLRSEGMSKPLSLERDVIQDDPQRYEGILRRWSLPLKQYSSGQGDRPTHSDGIPARSVEDVANRVFEIAQYFEYPEDPEHFFFEKQPEQFEYWLDEVQGYFEFMDLAQELHSIGCLFPLLHHVLVYPRAAGIRAKTAELVTTMVHNNPRNQHLVLELYGLEPLWHNFTSDPDETSRTKALGAISALIRNNELGITVFHERYQCYVKLRDALCSESVRLQREALNLIQYILHEKNSSDCNIVTKLGFPCLASSNDAEVRVPALRGLLVLARDEEGGNSGQLVKNDDKLKQVLQELIKRISAMPPEDLVAAREEIHLVDSLWNACYNEPYSLKPFEPSPRAWSAADWKLPIETKEAPFLQGLGPAVSTHTVQSN